jgi:hypothetical protein
VIECAPEARLEVDRLADPEEIVAEPSTVAPSRNCTVPVAVAGVTVAVRVTDWPGFAGFTLDATATVDALFTTWLRADDVDATVFASPLYDAVIAWEPAVRLDVEILANPDASVAELINVDPSKNWTVPVEEAGVTDAVNVTDCPGFAGFTLDATEVVEVALTTWLSAADVDPTVFASPL